MEQVRDRLRALQFSPRAEQACVDWIKRYIHFFDMQHPRELSWAHVERFLGHLASDPEVTAARRGEAAAALQIVYNDVLGIDLGGQPGAMGRSASTSGELPEPAARAVAAIERGIKHAGGRAARR